MRRIHIHRFPEDGAQPQRYLWILALFLSRYYWMQIDLGLQISFRLWPKANLAAETRPPWVNSACSNDRLGLPVHPPHPTYGQ
jgi:hypothetical protein